MKLILSLRRQVYYPFNITQNTILKMPVITRMQSKMTIKDIIDHINRLIKKMHSTHGPKNRMQVCLSVYIYFNKYLPILERTTKWLKLMNLAFQQSTRLINELHNWTEDVSKTLMRQYKDELYKFRSYAIPIIKQQFRDDADWKKFMLNNELWTDVCR